MTEEELSASEQRAERVFNGTRIKHARASRGEIQICKDIELLVVEVRRLRAKLDAWEGP